MVLVIDDEGIEYLIAELLKGVGDNKVLSSYIILVHNDFFSVTNLKKSVFI